MTDIKHDHVKTLIDNLRKKLLDPSKRNPLINLTHSERSVRFVRVVDELPDELYSRLKDGAMEFKPLPSTDEEPADEKTDNFRITLEEQKITDEKYLSAINNLGGEETDEENLQNIERELRDRLRIKLGLPRVQRGATIDIHAHAKAHHFDSSFDLPSTSADEKDCEHTDNYIQTLMLPDRLDKRIRSVHDKNRTHEQETGIPVLQAVFGFIEWYEDKNSNKALHAPLLLMPLQMASQPSRKGMRFLISSNGSSAEVNLTFSEKIKQYGIMLPDFEEDDTPELYFKKIMPLFECEPRWKLRRFVTIGIFPFQKISMYQDLDCDSWPESEHLTGHESIARLLGGKSSEGFTSNPPDYDIDKLTATADAPNLVMDADSSQHSAIIDVFNGKSLVIQGPPGTGKSQTIANIICTAVGQGKSVLFAAEKQAALNVVANRLKSVGLDPLLLELQKGADKAAIIASLKKRDELDQNNNDNILKIRSNSLKKHLNDIQRHHALLNKKSRFSELSGFELIWRYLKLKQFLDLEGLTSLPGYQAKGNLTTEQLEMDKESIKTFLEMEELDISSASCLTGVNKLEVNPIAIQRLKETSLEILSHLNQCSLEWDSLKISSKRFTLASVTEFSHKIKPIMADVDIIKLLVVVKSLEKFSDFYEEIKNIESISTVLNKYIHLDNADPERIRQSIIQLRDAGLSVFQTSKLIDLKTELGIQIAHLNKIQEITSQINVPQNFSLKQILAINKQFGDLENLHQDSVELINTEMLDPSNAGKLKNLIDEIIETQQLEISLHNDGVDIKAATRDYKSSVINEAAFEISNSGVFSFLSSSTRAAKRLASILGIDKQSKAEISELLKNVSHYIGLFQGLKNNRDAVNLCGGIYLSEKTDVSKLKNLVKTIEGINGFIDSLPTLAELLRSNTALLKSLVKTCSSSAFNMSCQALRDSQVDTTLSPHDLCSQLLLKSNAVIEIQSIAEAAGFHSNAYIPTGPIPTAEKQLLSDSVSKINISDLLDQLNVFTQAIQKSSNLFWDGACGLKLAEASTFIKKATAFRDAVLELYAGHGSENLSSYLQEICVPAISKINFTIFERAETSLLDFESKYSLDNRFWSGKSKKDLEISELLNLFTLIDSVPEESALHMAKKIKHEQAVKGTTVGDFINAFRTIKANPLAAEKLYEFIACKFSLDEFLSLNSIEFDELDATKITAIKSKFVSLDREILKLEAKRVLNRALQNDIGYGNDTGPKSSWTGRALIRNEISKKKRHIPIRKLVKGAEQALLAMKPIWLMSPLAVSQYLGRERGKFDLLVVDEASQMRPEDSLSSIVRAKQIVIVGDSQQLPPTNFFNSSLDYDDDQSDEVETESVLDLAVARLADSRTLRWHYRSRHPDLIRFSNKHFYKNELQIFPSPISDGSKLGITHIHSKNTYNASINVGEAKRVVEEAVRCMANNPELSLGIVTMNAKQKDLIREEMERLLSENSIVSEYYRRWKGNIEEFIIKNLENIQGDERDIIIVSTVYGPNEQGIVRQSFGINSVYGHRRLNVLFSRAKSRLILVTALQPSDIRLSDTTKKGVRTLRDYLEYAATKRLESGSEGGGEPDSDFEVTVIESLRDAGYIAVPQVGVDGFKIDIGVKHEDYSYGFIAGIECDGATYHSSASARDRDRLRQDILEGLGWKIYRIWSTDWFANPQAEVKRMLSWLGSVRSSLPMFTSDDENVALESSAEISPITLISKDLPEVDDFSEKELNPSGQKRELKNGDTVIIFYEPYPGFFQVMKDEKNIGTVTATKQNNDTQMEMYGNNVPSINKLTYSSRIFHANEFKNFEKLNDAVKWVYAESAQMVIGISETEEPCISADQATQCTEPTDSINDKPEKIESDDTFVQFLQNELESEKKQLKETIDIDPQAEQEIRDQIEYIESELEKKLGYSS